MKDIHITDKAKQEIRKLFSRNSVSTLKTDPELTELYDNFSFDMLLEHTKELSEKERVVIQMVATLGSKGNHQFQTMVNAALNVGVKPREIREVVYQAFPFIGFSKMLDFILFMNDVFENNDIKLPLDDQSTTTEEDREEKGLEVMEQIFGKEHVQQMFDCVTEEEKHITKFLAYYCYGGFFTRKGLDLEQRQLITFCLVASMPGTEQQILSHAQACNHLNISRKKIVSAVTAMIPYIGFPKALNALAAINKAYK